MRVQLFRKADTVRRLQRENSRLKKKLSGYENNTLHSAIRKCLEKVGTAQFCLEDFLVEQITNAPRQQPVWSPDFVLECVLLYYLSPKAYRYIRNRGLLKLPSKNTLLRYVGKSDGEKGITPLMKERLKEEQTAKENSAAAENISNIMLANKVLCFVATGLSTAYEIPCGFFFTNHLCGKLLYQLTKEVISEVEKCGLCVIRIVTDNHKINVTMMRHLGNGSLKPVVTHPCDPERSLFVSFDQCHIIKNVRSLLLEGEMTDGSQPITGQFVKQLYDLQKKEVVKPVRFLTQKHVEPTNFEKMHVGRAVQLFSDDVISALSFLKEYPSHHPQADKFRNAGATILFMKMMQKWFAIHNVANRTAHVHMRQPDQMHFFCATDERLQWLEKDFPDYLKAIDNSCKRSGKKFLSAETYEVLLLTSKSTVLCVKFLLESGFFYVLTRNLSSDPVELLFSSLRQMAGGNDCLDARAVTFSLERILRTGNLCPSQSSNVENGQAVLRSPFPDGCDNGRRSQHSASFAVSSDLIVRRRAAWLGGLSSHSRSGGPISVPPLGCGSLLTGEEVSPLVFPLSGKGLVRLTAKEIGRVTATSTMLPRSWLSGTPRLAERGRKQFRSSALPDKMAASNAPAKRRTMPATLRLRFTVDEDLCLHREVRAVNPFASPEGWTLVYTNLLVAIQDRVDLLLGYFRQQDTANLRK
ncbi:hypothetical protein HPB47_019505 [Ixodes persulcatus]|uniref:Uncharacterized protein n=1 Tax=Ixodes persulcatus TaxID=34615 RepID=A0AC60QIW1_IXOPE|nr:hypothetical protein HPB47_019505 [Ixodes persulcatus]